MARTSRRSRPMVDGLEGRQLLNARMGAHPAALAGNNPLNVRAFGYDTAAGARVTIEVRGSGDLNGTTLAPGGALELVYGGTNPASKIFVAVRGGPRTAPLESVTEAGLPAQDYSGVGGQLLGSFLAPGLDLIDNGAINMTSGVGRVQLHSIGANAQVHLRDLPQTFAASVSSSSANSGGTAISTVTVAGGTTTAGGTSGIASATGTTTGTAGTTPGFGGVNGGIATTTTGSTGTSSTSIGSNSGGLGNGSTQGTGGATLGTNGSLAGTTGSNIGISGGTTSSTSGSIQGTSSGGTNVGTTSTIPGVGNSFVTNPGLSSGAVFSTLTFTSTTVVTGGNGQPATIPPGEEAVSTASLASGFAPASYSWAGRTLTYSNSPLGGTTLTSASGQFSPTANLISTPDRANPGPPPQPPGIVIQVGSVRGAGGVIGDPQVFGYDPTANTLIRFDAYTGAALQAIPVGGTPTKTAGVGLGRDGRELVVLLSRGTTVQAFDAATGVPVGTFSAADLAGFGMTAIDGVASVGTTTVLSDSADHVPTQPIGTVDYGAAVAIDVRASLAAGVAVIHGKPFYTDNGFTFSGGATGLPGSNNVYFYGGAPFNPNESTFTQAGVLNVAGTPSGNPREGGRVALANPNDPQGTTPFVNIGAVGQPLTGKGPALGSVEQMLAVDQGVVNGANSVRLFVPGTLAQAGSIRLNDPNLLASLSTSFHPELAGSALVDVQGNVQTFAATSAVGLALNVAGNLDKFQVRDAANATVVAEPLSHVNIARRSNVVLVSTTRAVGVRNGVVVNPFLRQIGPLSLPD